MCLASFAMAATALAEEPLPGYRYDFNNGIPSEITLVDADGLQPSQDVAVYGFEVGVPWVPVKLEDSHLTAAASTSWYTTPGTSSDWMILPPLRVEGERMILKWAAKAHDAQLSDGYSVYVSDGGDTPADFNTASPLFSVEVENGKWTKHEVSLAEYAGKMIRVAFVNNSTDKALLYIDDIVAEEKRDIDADRMLPGLLKVGETLQVTGEIYNNGDKTLVGVSVDFTIDGKTYSESLPHEDVMSGWSYTAYIDTDFSSDTPGIFPYTLSIRMGDQSIVREGSLYVAQRNVVVEEGTGTWCGWCPRGAVAMEAMNGKYPGQFIGVAVHCGKDPMSVDDYVVSANSYPVCVANRLDKYKGNPSDMEEYFLAAREAGPVAAIFGSADYSASSREIVVKSSVTFADSYTEAGFGISYILKENDVHVDDPTYNQANYYSGGEEVMGGFETLPDPVPAADMWYQEVARLQAGGYEGFEGSIPQVIVAGEPVAHECVFALPESVISVEKIQLVGIVVDRRSGEIINASVIPVSGISSVRDAEVADGLSVVRDGRSLRVVSESAVDSIRAIDMRGAVVAASLGSDVICLDGVPHGVVVLQIMQDGGCRYLKIMI